MYCPNCGNQAAAEQKFCRSCGIGLQTIGQALTNELVAAKLAPPPDESVTNAESREKRFERRGKMVGMLGLAMLMLMIGSLFVFIPLNKFFGVSFAALNFIAPLVMSIAIPLLFVGFGLIIYPRLVKELFPRSSPSAPALPPAETTTKLSPARQPEPLTSIAESTTELLATSQANASGHKPGALAKQMSDEPVAADTTNELTS